MGGTWLRRLGGKLQEVACWWMQLDRLLAGFGNWRADHGANMRWKVSGIGLVLYLLANDCRRTGAISRRCKGAVLQEVIDVAVILKLR